MIRILKIVVLVFVLSFVDEVFCIKCWRCDSKVDPKCGVPFDNSTIQLADCSATLGPTDEVPNFCVTQKEKVNGVQSYKRYCGFKILAADMPCAAKTGLTDQGEQTFREFCPCYDRDGCNDSENQ